MPLASRLAAAFPLLLALGVAPACCAPKPPLACEQGPQGKLLLAALDAHDSRAFNQALGQHGPVQTGELPCLTGAATGHSSDRRRFAARLLVIARGDPAAARAAQIRVARETGDPAVWAPLVRPLLERDPGAEDARPATGRADMIQQALRFSDEDRAFAGEVQAAGLRAGIVARSPGIDAELGRRLDARDRSLLVALDALPSARARAELPRLLRMLDAHEAGERFPGDGHEFFVALLGALVRGSDPAADAAARAALARGFTDPATTTGSRPELMSFSNAAVLRPEPEMKRFLRGEIRANRTLAPVGFDILSRQVWAAQVAPGVELVEACVALLEPGWDPTPSIRHHEQGSCSNLLYFMATGANPTDPGKGPRLSPAESLTRARAWLGACARSHACEP